MALFSSARSCHEEELVRSLSPAGGTSQERQAETKVGSRTYTRWLENVSKGQGCGTTPYNWCNALHLTSRKLVSDPKSRRYRRAREAVGVPDHRMEQLRSCCRLDLGTRRWQRRPDWLRAGLHH